MTLFKKIGFYSAFILIAIYALSYVLGSYWHFSTLIFVFIVVPFADFLIGKDHENIADNEITIISTEFYYKLITYLWVYAQLALVIFGAYAVTLGSVNTVVEWIGFVLTTSLITGGVGITVAHELGHKKSKWEQFYSKALLMTVCYMHFYIEHNRGHHVHVATPVDPATSRKDESFYRFWFRSVSKGYLSAWKIESNARERKE